MPCRKHVNFGPVNKDFFFYWNQSNLTRTSIESAKLLSICYLGSFLIKVLGCKTYKLWVLHCLLWKGKATPSLAKVATTTTNISSFLFLFLQQFGSPSLAIKPLYDFRALVKMPAWLRPIWIWTGGCLSSLGPGVMEPVDGWDMVTLLWLMNMKPFTVSSCHVTKRSPGLWEWRAFSLCQDKQRPLNSWGCCWGCC